MEPKSGRRHVRASHVGERVKPLGRALAIALIAGCWVSLLPARELAISFDDAPRAGSSLMTGDQRATALIEGLEKAGVEGAIFFSTVGHIEESGHQRMLRYQKAGHFIANHSFSHQRPGRMGLEAFLEDIRAADAVLRQYANFIHLFRFPFLDEGRDEATRDGIRSGLARMGYRNGYVTVDNYDWYIDRLLQNALEAGREVDYAGLGELYVRHLADSAEFYDRIARDALGRSPRHVLLLHENDLAAMYLHDLVSALKQRGWVIIPGPDAYADPIAEIVTETLFNNQGRVAAIAEMQGMARIDLVQESEDEAWLDRVFNEAGVFGPAPGPRRDPSTQARAY